MIQIGLDENSNDAYLFTTIIIEPNGLFSLDTVKPNNDLYLRDTTILNGSKVVRIIENTELFITFQDEINGNDDCIMLDGIISYNVDRSLDTILNAQTIMSANYNNLSNLSAVDNADDVTFSLVDGGYNGSFELEPYIVRSSNIHTTISGSKDIKFAINYGFLGAYINVSNLGSTFTFKLITNSNKVGVSENISYARTINMSIIPAGDIISIPYTDYSLIIEYDYANSNLNMILDLLDGVGASLSLTSYTFDISEIVYQNTIHVWGSYDTANLDHLDLTYRINTTATLLYQYSDLLYDFDYELKYSANYDKLYPQRERNQFSNLVLNGSSKSKNNYKTSILYSNSYSTFNNLPLNIGMFDYYYSPMLNMYSIRPFSPETITLKNMRSYVISDGYLINNSHPDDLEKMSITLDDASFNIAITNEQEKSKLISYSQAGEYGNHEKYMNAVGVLKRLDDDARFELLRAYKKETSIQVKGLKILCSAFDVVNPKGIAITSNPSELNKEIYTDINYNYNDISDSKISFDDSGLLFSTILPSVAEKLKDRALVSLLNTISVLGLQILLKINNRTFPVTIDLGPSGRILSTSKIVPISVKVIMHGGRF